MISRDMQNNRTQPRLQTGEYTRIWGPLQALDEFERYSAYLEQEMEALIWKFQDVPEEHKAIARDACRALTRLSDNAYETFHLNEKDFNQISQGLNPWIQRLVTETTKNKSLKWHLVRMQGKIASFQTALAMVKKHYQRVAKDLQRFLVSERVDFNEFVQVYQELENIIVQMENNVPVTESQKETIASLTKINDQILQFDIHTSIRSHRKPDTTPVDRINAMVNRMQDLVRPSQAPSLSVCPDKNRQDTKGRRVMGIAYPESRVRRERWQNRNPQG